VFLCQLKDHTHSCASLFFATFDFCATQCGSKIKGYKYKKKSSEIGAQYHHLAFRVFSQVTGFAATLCQCKLSFVFMHEVSTRTRKQIWLFQGSLLVMGQKKPEEKKTVKVSHLIFFRRFSSYLFYRSVEGCKKTHSLHITFFAKRMWIKECSEKFITDQHPNVLVPGSETTKSEFCSNLSEAREIKKCLPRVF